MLTLSICIPSYNRFEKLSETVKEILRAKSNDFEVVIVDNCSPRNIEDFVNCNDSRIRIVKRESPVYGAKNVGDAVLFGNGQYSLLLLDKDRIDGSGLDSFVETLKNSQVAGGYCELNSKNSNIRIVKDRRIEKFGYLSKHPSGNFYNISLLRDYIKDKSELLEKDPFPFDIYLAYCAKQGDMLYYDVPCVCSALNDFSQDDKNGSLTFNKDSGNMYYFPANVIQEFEVYVACFNELEVDKTTRKQVISRLYKQTLHAVTKGYRDIMKHEGICTHYHHRTEKIGLLKMIGFAKAFRKSYYGTSITDISNKEKRVIECDIFKKVLLKKLRK